MQVNITIGTEQDNVSRNGTSRRKIRVRNEDGIYIGSTWVSANQDSGEQLLNLLEKIGASVIVAKGAKQTEGKELPAYLL